MPTILPDNSISGKPQRIVPPAALKMSLKTSLTAKPIAWVSLNPMINYVKDVCAQNAASSRLAHVTFLRAQAEKANF